MNKLTLTILSLTAVVAILLSGCMSTQKTPAVPAQPSSTNSATGVITPPVPAVPEQVLYVVSPKLAYVSSNEAALYGQYAPIVGAVYPPAQPILTAAQGIFGAVMSVITGVSVLMVRRKNKEKLSIAKDLDTANGVAKSIIQGVESAGAAAAEVKKVIANAALKNGNADHVETAVNAVTGSH